MYGKRESDLGRKRTFGERVHPHLAALPRHAMTNPELRPATQARAARWAEPGLRDRSSGRAEFRFPLAPPISLGRTIHDCGRDADRSAISACTSTSPCKRQFGPAL
jgi:hypothetical protein